MISSSLSRELVKRTEHNSSIVLARAPAPTPPQHDLQMDLLEYIVNEFPDVGPRLTEFGNKSPKKRRRHPPNIPCTRIGTALQTGTISVQHA